MTIRLARDMTVTVLDDGCLELYSEWAAESYRYAPPMAAMWIALQQHAGQLEPAVAALARHWESDPLWVRFEFDTWLGDMRAAGLLFYDDA
ncbi:hypothetical protein [Streptomyces boncukensis]|uniref:Uncharacterized protein n=1 Tax=Streptomyces boncukensis TaxID=2711219 RepID=A0A6G4WWM0_9ACTN|nr:hypothetical protein [Streptomyces boncukensis]NGO68861.1 hypothetical protein [Streptomyces boncukensis]